MSNLLEQASLVMIPSGYKEDVVYSQIPLDGSGDMTLTRASNGTRVNSAGLVEVCPWNLAEQSETIGVSPWQNQNVTITNNATTAPNGTSTAEKIIENTSNGYHQVYQEIFASGSVVGQDYTFSCYAKASERNKITFLLQTPNISEATFDLINGTASITGGSGTAGVAIESVGNGWYRCSIYRLNTTTGYIYGNLQINNGTGTVYTGDGTSGVFVWGAQLNIGSTAKPYFPTTDRLNVPRLTYQNGGGGCPSLLLEKQSTNLALWSEDFTQTAWVKTTGGSGAAPSVTANAGISPDGTQNADRVQFDCVGTTTSDRSILRQSISISNSTAYTFTFYVKAYSSGEIGKELNIRAENITGNPNITLTADWQRVSVSGTSSATSTLLIVETRGSVTANTTADILIWGAQLEASSYSTSYIPTTSSSATRVADACSKTGISSLIGQTEGTVFVDYFYLNNSTDDITIGIDGNNGKFIWFRANGVQFYGNSGALLFSATSTKVQGSRYKIAFVYGQSDFRLYVNGSVIANVTTGTFTGTFDDFRFFPVGGAPFENSNSFNQITLFPTKLTNAELASLTTI